MMRKIIYFIGVGLFSFSCETEIEKVPIVKTPIVDTVKEQPKVMPKENTTTVNPHDLYLKKLEQLPQVLLKNKELIAQKMPPLKSKIVDKASDSLFLIKFGKILDTNFVSEFEFYVNKNTKSISVYDKGEDMLIPLEKWQEDN